MLCVPGDLHRPLYLIHSGAVAVLDAVPEEGSKDTTDTGGEHGLRLQRKERMGNEVFSKSDMNSLSQWPNFKLLGITY